MPVDCISIRTGQECGDIQPPDGKPRDCLLQIVCRDGKTISLCIEGTDDCLAWKFTLQDSRTNAAYVGSAILSEEAAVASLLPPYTTYAIHQPLRSKAKVLTVAHTPQELKLFMPPMGRRTQCLPKPVCSSLWTTSCQPIHHL